jgi:hypothetical protein
MADTKISALTASTVPLAGTEVLPIVQSGTKKVSVANLTAGRDVATAALLSTKTSAGAVVDVATIQNVSNTAGTEAALFFAPTTAAGNIRGARISGINDGDNIIGLKFYTGAGATITSKLEIEGATTGNVTLTTGNLVIGTAGKGIDFTQDPNPAGMTSELLDDYEEGTWTPTISFGGASVGVTYDAQVGRYTKVGRVVTIQVAVALSNKGSSTGNATIGGLPFTSINPGAYGDSPVVIGWQTNIAVANSSARVDRGSTDISFYELTALTPTQLTNTQFANNSAVIIGGSYMV